MLASQCGAAAGWWHAVAIRMKRSAMQAVLSKMLRAERVATQGRLAARVMSEAHQAPAPVALRKAAAARVVAVPGRRQILVAPDSIREREAIETLAVQAQVGRAASLKRFARSARPHS